MTSNWINKIIRDEIDNINASDSEINLIHELLNIEKWLLNNNKTQYMKEYKKAVENAAGVRYK